MLDIDECLNFNCNIIMIYTQNIFPWKPKVVGMWLLIQQQLGGESLSEKKHTQWNLRIKDSLGAELLSSFQRLSSGGRFIQIAT